tara:strand:+ start:67 stop:255 length:189 start_codon:yes stop_codon:yes gene_type:complete
MGFFKNIDIMLHNGDDDSTIAKWIRENAKDPNISKDESLDIIAEMRHMWESARDNHYRGFNQ